MESSRNKVVLRRCMQVIALCIGLQGALDLRASLSDMFPQDRLPSLGVTADTVVRELQRDLRRQRQIAGFQLVASAFLMLAAARELRVADGR